MFLINVGHRWTHATSVSEVTAAIYLAAGSSSERLNRADLPDHATKLFDPQLYLAGLDAASCATACARLATYPWFCAELPEFDSSQTNRKQWEAALKAKVAEHWVGTAPKLRSAETAVTAALQYQIDLSCTHMILPSPLITEREDEAETQAEWLDFGITAAQDLDVGQPVLATIAVEESALNDSAFEPAGFLDTVIDQVKSRDEINGVYILVAQTHAEHPFHSDSRVQRAYLQICNSFKRSGYETILVNFADVFGEVCMAAGATGFASGPSHALRRLSLQAFQEAGGGLALPKFFSHRVVAEFLTQRDLDQLSEKGLIGRVRDITRYSEPLFEVISAEGTAAQVPDWVQSQNNLAAAGKHFIARLAVEAHELAQLSPRRKRERVTEWLDDATANQLFLQRRLGEKFELVAAPTEMWQELLSAIVGRG